VIYNAVHTRPVVFAQDEEPEDDGAPLADGPMADGPEAIETFHLDVVLDGDVEFYEIDPETVWSRQESIFVMVLLVYGIVEPLSSDVWQGILRIKGQEVWVLGGPTTTNKVDLTNELTDPDYFLLHPVTDRDIHLFFPGYDVGGVYGRAAGIGNSSAFGGGAGMNHAFSEARASQSLKAKWVVAAHEMGHLIGGTHGNGVTSGCAGGLFDYICGPSLMPAGSAGEPEGRAPYFSDANDLHILSVLQGVL
jgi:hypothetical protein